MCGRSTYKLTWEEIVALYGLTLDQPPHNFQPRYNVWAKALQDHLPHLGLGLWTRAKRWLGR